MDVRILGSGAPAGFSGTTAEIAAEILTWTAEQKTLRDGSFSFYNTDTKAFGLFNGTGVNYDTFKGVSAVSISDRNAELIQAATEYVRLWIDTAGDVVCMPIDSGVAVTYKNVPVGYLDVHVQYVTSVAGVAAGSCTSLGIIG